MPSILFLVFVYSVLITFTHCLWVVCCLFFLVRIEITWHIKNIVLPYSSFSTFLETFVINFTNRLRVNRHTEACTLQFRAARTD